MDRERLLQAISEAELNYDEPITAEELSDILFEYWERGWYLEELRWDAGRWDSFCYLSYYDENARAVILSKDIWREINWFEDDDDVADFLLELDEIYNYYRKKFLQLKED